MPGVEWLELAVRWIHVIAGIAWIGTSFYFIRLNAVLAPAADPGEGVEGGMAEGLAPLPGREGEGEAEAVFAFTPYTVKPKCASGCTPEDILRHVPPLLQRSAIQCDLTVGIRVDTEGKITATDLLKSSGNSACDKAAEQWAVTTKWTTAYNRDQAVTVWIAQPVSIKTDSED